MENSVDRKNLQTIMNKFHDSIWRKRILWGLGVLIVSAIIFVRIFSTMAEKELKLGWDLINTQNSEIVYDAVNSIAFDKSGRAWIGTFDGVSVFDGETWLSYTMENSALEQTGAIVYTIEVDSEGRIWIGLASGIDGSIGGLIIVNGEVWEAFPGNSPPLLGSVFAIAFDENNQAWIGTDQGVHIFDGTTWEILSKENSGLIANSIRAIEFDQKGGAWIGTIDGLSYFDGESWRSFTESNSDIPQDLIDCIGFDQRGNTWIGWRGGTSVYDGESWSNYNWHHSYPGIDGDYPDDVEVITSDSYGRTLFISEAALRIYDGDLWKEYNSSNSGFFQDFVYDLTIDPQGNIWIATGSGILVANVDDSGFPRLMFQDTSQINLSIFNLLPRQYLLLGIIILSIFWFAILLNDSILVICGAATAYFLIFNPNDFSSLIVIPATSGGILGSIIRKLRKKPSLLPTKIGIIIGIVASVLFLLVGSLMSM